MNAEDIGYQSCSKGHTVWLGRPMRKCPVPGCEGLGNEDGSAGVREPRSPYPTEGADGRELDGTYLRGNVLIVAHELDL